MRLAFNRSRRKKALGTPQVERLPRSVSTMLEGFVEVPSACRHINVRESDANTAHRGQGVEQPEDAAKRVADRALDLVERDDL